MRVLNRCLALVVPLILLASCATHPAGQASGADLGAAAPASVIARPAEKAEVSRYGGGLTNPYRTPDGTFTKSKEALVVFVVEIAARRGASISVDYVDVLEGDFRFLDRQEFADWWDLRRAFEEDDAAKRKAIARSYLPDTGFAAREALTKRFIALVGDRPLDSKARIRVQLSVDGYILAAEAEAVVAE